MKLQNLLAPTWHERVRTEKALIAQIIKDPEHTGPWPKEIQDEIRSLKPSPEIFLSALVAFWADVSAQQYKKRMKNFLKNPDSCLSGSWSSPHLAAFPMIPAVPSVSTDFMCGMWVWSFISRLGPYAEKIEQQLIACLDHPELLVQDAAESVFGTVSSMTDEGFAKFLAVADQRGRNGLGWKRAEIIAGHVYGKRMTMILHGLEPGVSEKLSSARFAIIRKLNGNNAEIGHRYLLRHIAAPWSDNQLADLIRAITEVSEKTGFETQAVSTIRQFAEHDNCVVRCAATLFLASHSPDEHYEILKILAKDAHPWILSDLCYGLEKHSNPPPELVRAAVSRSLGNYNGGDDEPHDSAVRLLVRMGQNARIALPEILVWWNDAYTNNCLDRENITDALNISDALGISAVPLKNGLEHALILLTTDDEEENDLPVPEQPDAVQEIQVQLNEEMELENEDDSISDDDLVIRLRNSIKALDNLDKNTERFCWY